MCLYPKLIINPKYKSNKKNGGNIPFMKDDRVKYVPIGCQGCIECKRKKSREWKVRLNEEIKLNKYKFITLTFSDKSISKLYIECEKKTDLKGYDKDNWAATRAVRLWLENVRKSTKKSVRHWLITELGHRGTKNIHIHGLINVNNKEHYNLIISKWENNFGNVYPKKDNDYKNNYVNEKTISYIVKYVTKMDLEHKGYSSIILTSAGIGKNYVNSYNYNRNKFNKEKTKEYYITETGHKLSLPIYYRNKLYSDDEKENLWLYKLDEGIRYVMGEKIKVTDVVSMNEYEELRKYWSNENIKMGYTNGEISEERKNYEKQQRILAQKTRIAKTNKKLSRQAI